MKKALSSGHPLFDGYHSELVDSDTELKNHLPDFGFGELVLAFGHMHRLENIRTKLEKTVARIYSGTTASVTEIVLPTRKVAKIASKHEETLRKLALSVGVDTTLSCDILVPPLNL